jgi:hypothetical protein
MKISGLVNKSVAVLKGHSPAILMGVGCVGMVSTVILAVRATPKAVYLLEEAYDPEDPWAGREKTVDQLVKELGPKKTVETTWKCYIPATVVGLGSVACLLMSHRLSAGKSAAMASAYSLLERTMDEYQDRVIEQIGKDKNDDIRQEVQQAVVESSGNEEIIPYGNGEILCFESLTGRYFKSSENTIMAAVNDFNHDLIHEFSCTMNDWFYLLGLPNVAIGDSLGWTTDHMLDVDIRTVKAPNGLPALAIDYRYLPR